MGKLQAAVAANQKARRKGPECSVAVLLRRLSKDDRADLEAVMAPDSGYMHSVIAEVCRTQLDADVSRSAIARHRKQECRCGRTR